MKKLKFIVSLLISSLLTGNFCFAQELLPNDPFYSQQWYLQKLGLPEVWALETGKTNVILAIIDSGVDISHPDLHDNIWVNQKEILGDNIDNDHNGYIDDISGWDFIENNNDVMPKYDKNCLKQNTCVAEGIFHGTFVAGVAGAVGNNGQGITGLAWQTKIMPLRVLSQNGSGNTVDVVRAIDYAVDNGANIINLSFVGDTFDLGLDQALDRAYNKGVLIVAAAGNENFAGSQVNLDLQKRYPVCHQGANNENIIIGVGASDANNKLAYFSDYGSSCVDVIAPGDNFFGTLVYDPLVADFNQYYGGDFSGTSLAAPIVSGLAALIKSYQPALTNREIRDAILNNTDNIDAQNPGYIGELGQGLVNPVKVFQSLKISISFSSLVKGSSDAVYYYGADGKRYVFPDTKAYFSWYDDFSQVKIIKDSELAQIIIGGNVTFRPGSLVKIQTDSKVYAVAKGGVLRWVKDESIVQALYGNNWQNSVQDIADVFFINYKEGAPIASASDFNPFVEKNTVLTIDIDKGL